MRCKLILGLVFIFGYAQMSLCNYSENTILMESVLLEDIDIANKTNSIIETSNLKASDKNVNKTSPRVKSKAVAITLAVTLGVFGVHRLYLGTSNKVPIIYTLTLGGGFGVLVVSDIVAIIATKNLDEYTPSEKVFMWAK